MGNEGSKGEKEAIKPAAAAAGRGKMSLFLCVELDAISTTTNERTNKREHIHKSLRPINAVKGRCEPNTKKRPPFVSYGPFVRNRPIRMTEFEISWRDLRLKITSPKGCVD